MPGYVFGQSQGAQLRAAHARVAYLESALTTARKHASRPPRDTHPSFDSEAFRAEYSRERAWAERRYPEPIEQKQARLDAIRAELIEHGRRQRTPKGQP